MRAAVMRHHALVVDDFPPPEPRAGGPVVMDIDRDVVIGHESRTEAVDYGPDTARRLADARPIVAVHSP